MLSFQNKNLLTLDNGLLADHTNAVTGLAAASRNNTGIMGIAYGADLLATTFENLPNAEFEDKVNWITEHDGDVWSNSLGSGGVQLENDQIGEVVNFRNTQGLTSGQALAQSLDAPGTQARWDAIAAAMDKFQANGGVVVWANDTLPHFLRCRHHARVAPSCTPELREAWIVVVNATAESTLRNAGNSSSGLITEGGYALLSAPCGRNRSVLPVDGWIPGQIGSQHGKSAIWGLFRNINGRPDGSGSHGTVERSVSQSHPRRIDYSGLGVCRQFLVHPGWQQ